MADQKKTFNKRVRCTIYINCTAMLIYANQCQLHNYYLKYCLYVNNLHEDTNFREMFLGLITSGKTRMENDVLSQYLIIYLSLPRYRSHILKLRKYSIQFTFLHKLIFHFCKMRPCFLQKHYKSWIFLEIIHHSLFIKLEIPGILRRKWPICFDLDPVFRDTIAKENVVL